MDVSFTIAVKFSDGKNCFELELSVSLFLMWKDKCFLGMGSKWKFRNLDVSDDWFPLFFYLIPVREIYIWLSFSEVFWIFILAGAPGSPPFYHIRSVYLSSHPTLSGAH